QELQETGFYDMNARFYMADLGRFGQHDPLSANTLDPYGYGYNNPIFFADPTGLEGEPVPGGSGPGGPQAIGTASSPIDVGEIVLNPPIRAVSNNNLATCSYCMTGQGQNLREQLNIPPPPSQPLPKINYMTCGHCFDGPIRYIGGAGDPWGIWEILGIAASSQESTPMKLAILPLLVVTKNGDDALKLLAAEKGLIESQSKIWKVGPYNELRGVETGLDAHHVGQSAVMKKLVTDFEHNTGPSILVPAVGHRFKGPNGIVSRNTKGFENARQLLARDIFELRRVSGSQKLPNSALKELIEVNKNKFPEAFKKANNK
ncbi:RHS repeat domain-containing protein, partial [Chryseobacterium flavum]